MCVYYCKQLFFTTSGTCMICCVAALQLRHDVENVTARLHYMSEAKDTVEDDIALTKRATEKTAVDVTRAQEEKQKQVCACTCYRD